MNRFRVALLAVLALITAVVVVTVIRPPTPSSLGGTASATLLPEGERVAAPDFQGIDAWINSRPLSAAGLRGHVVLVDFWTFSCVNCVRTLPHLRDLYGAYRSHGFELIGVHSPEFDFEKPVTSVRAAVHRLGVTWPVAVDSEMATWNAFGNQYWPAEYLLDQSGRIAYTSIGEGQAASTERAVARLLGFSAGQRPAPTPVPAGITPELYAGSERGHLADGAAYAPAGQPAAYPDHGPPVEHDAIQVTGTWVDQGQYLEAATAATVRLDFNADSVYVVAGRPDGTLHVVVLLDGRPPPAAFSAPSLRGSAFDVQMHDLYPLLSSLPPGRHLIELRVPAGFELYTLTFG